MQMENMMLHISLQYIFGFVLILCICILYLNEQSTPTRKVKSERGGSHILLSRFTFVYLEQADKSLGSNMQANCA